MVESLLRDLNRWVEHTRSEWGISQEVAWIFLGTLLLWGVSLLVYLVRCSWWQWKEAFSPPIPKVTMTPALARYLWLDEQCDSRSIVAELLHLVAQGWLAIRPHGENFVLQAQHSNTQLPPVTQALVFALFGKHYSKNERTLVLRKHDEDEKNMEKWENAHNSLQKALKKTARKMLLPSFSFGCLPALVLYGLLLSNLVPWSVTPFALALFFSLFALLCTKEIVSYIQNVLQKNTDKHRQDTNMSLSPLGIYIGIAVILGYFLTFWVVPQEILLFAITSSLLFTLPGHFQSFLTPMGKQIWQRIKRLQHTLRRGPLQNPSPLFFQNLPAKAIPLCELAYAIALEVEEPYFANTPPLLFQKHEETVAALLPDSQKGRQNLAHLLQLVDANYLLH